MQEVWTEHTKSLPPLKVGDLVRVQNQIGNAPRKWDKSGTIVEVRQHDQYVVKVDGSNRATLRNRKFLRKYQPMLPRNPSPILRDQLASRNHIMNKIPNRLTSDQRHSIDGDTDADMHPHQSETTGRGSEEPDRPVNGGAQQPKPPKMPMALRRLVDFNSKGLKE